MTYTPTSVHSNNDEVWKSAQGQAHLHTSSFDITESTIAIGQIKLDEESSLSTTFRQTNFFTARI